MRIRAAAAVMLMFLGCNLEQFAAHKTIPIIKRGTRALASEADVEFARAAAPAEIKSGEGLLETLPDDRDALDLTAYGYLQYAFGFVEDDIESSTDPAARQVLVLRATDLYDRALGFALRFLATFDPRFEEAFRAGGAPFERAVDGLPRAAVPGLTYAGVAIASSIRINRGDPSRLVDLPKAIKLLQRGRALDPRFAASVASMVLGVIYGQAPAIGGQPEKSKPLFEEAIALTKRAYLFHQVNYARTYAVAIGDRHLFQTLLEQVLAARAERLPRDYRLANELAKRRAAIFLHQANSLFRSDGEATARKREP